MLDRPFTAWLRPVLTLLGLAGLLTLAACGGGSGAPNNPYDAAAAGDARPDAAAGRRSPSTPGSPVTLTVSGGVAPYRAFSSDPTALPVASTVSSNTVVLAANSVTATTTVSITVQDSHGPGVDADHRHGEPGAAAAFADHASTSNPNPACTNTTNAICSGGTGTATVKVTGAGGAGIANRQVRFDVVQGSFSIQTTNPGQPNVSTLTVVSDCQRRCRRRARGRRQHADADRRSSAPPTSRPATRSPATSRSCRSKPAARCCRCCRRATRRSPDRRSASARRACRSRSTSSAARRRTRSSTQFPGAVTLTGVAGANERRVVHGHHQRHLLRQPDVRHHRRDRTHDPGRCLSDGDQRAGNDTGAAAPAGTGGRHAQHVRPHRLRPGQHVPVHHHRRYAAVLGGGHADRQPDVAGDHAANRASCPARW